MKKESAVNLLLFIGIFALDRITKYILVDRCMGVFCVRTAFNTGASFGILDGLVPLFIVVASMILVIIGYFYNKVDPKIKLAFVLIGAGTLGNLLDRIFYGGVIDLFAVWRSSSFNIADLSNLAGGVLLLYVIYFQGKKRKKK